VGEGEGVGVGVPEGLGVGVLEGEGVGEGVDDSDGELIVGVGRTVGLVGDSMLVVRLDIDVCEEVEGGMLLLVVDGLLLLVVGRLLLAVVGKAVSLETGDDATVLEEMLAVDEDGDDAVDRTVEREELAGELAFVFWRG
jgi:hypothetical protein